MENTIYPCLWFDGNAKQAAKWYCAAFENSIITAETPMVVTFEIEGVKLMGLNGGPHFKPTAAISFYIMFESTAELQRAWDKLAEGGIVLMPLDKYDWSERYGWVQDQFGVSWQLSLSKEVGQHVVPLLMFCGEQQGRASAAIDYYVSVFKDSTKDSVAKYEPDQLVDAHDATIVHARFRLNDQLFMAMDSAVPQPFTFTEGVSLVIDCETQEEVDYYWDKLSDGGEESMCGWLKDRFGVSWQVVPTILSKLLSDPERSERVVQAFMKMRKFDIEKLINA